jgi:hypothetical protein
MDEMTQLEELHLTSNRLSGVPHTFGRLRRLERFKVGGNDFFVEPQVLPLRVALPYAGAPLLALCPPPGFE